MTAVEHQHPVRLFHRRQAVGNDQRGAALEKTRQRLMQVVLGGSVQRRGGFVQDDHLGLGQHHACNGQPLALATGQTYARAPDHAVQAVGQRGDGAVELGDPQCLPAGIIGAVPAHGQVGPHAVVEQRRVLQDHRHLLTQGFQADFLQGGAAEANGACIGAVQPEQQLHERALATPAGADDGHLLAGCDGQVQVIEHRFVGVGKGQIPYLDTHRGVPGKGVTGRRVLGLVGACQ